MVTEHSRSLEHHITWHHKLYKEKDIHFQLIFGHLESCCTRWSVASCPMARMLMILLIFIRKSLRPNLSFPSFLMIRQRNNLWGSCLLKSQNLGLLKSLLNLRIIFILITWIGKNLPKRKLLLLLCQILKIREIKQKSTWKLEISWRRTRTRRKTANLKYLKSRIGIKSFESRLIVLNWDQ